MNPITYKLVTGDDGSFDHLEIWQHDQCIAISLGAETPHRNGARWTEMRETIDSMQARVQREAAERATMNWPPKETE